MTPVAVVFCSTLFFPLRRLKNAFLTEPMTNFAGRVGSTIFYHPRALVPRSSLPKRIQNNNVAHQRGLIGAGLSAQTFHAPFIKQSVSFQITGVLRSSSTQPVPGLEQVGGRVHSLHAATHTPGRQFFSNKRITAVDACTQVPVYGDLNSFLQAAAPELVVITTPTHTHYRSVPAGPGGHKPCIAHTRQD